MPTEPPIARILIVGGGIAGWLAASMLSARLDDVEITLLDATGSDASLGLARPVEQLLPADIELLEAAGYDQPGLIRGTRAAVALGSAVSGWQAGAAPAFLPFGDIGAPIGPIAFHQLVTRLRQQGKAVSLANHALAALCAQSGRFAPPHPADRSVHAMLVHGLHVDSVAFAHGMKADALARGVRVQQGRAADIVHDAEGLVAAIRTTEGEQLAADLFIDAGGPHSPLAGPFEDWSHWLPCDRIASALRPAADAPPLYAHCDAHPSGWQLFLPRVGAVGDSLIQCSAAAGNALAPGAVAFRSGRQRAPWRGNLLAIGGAAAVVDSIAANQLHLALSGIARLLGLFPADRACRAEAAEYNRQTIAELECARDFAILPFKLNGRIGEPFWDACRAAPVPDRLAYAIALHQSCGRVVLHDGETVEESGFVALFDAFGLQPRRHDALANALPTEAIEAHCARVRTHMLQAVAAMPTHADWLQGLSR